MKFEEKIKHLRTLTQFKVAPLSALKAIAFVLNEKGTVEENERKISKIGSTLLVLKEEDIEKIKRLYPELF